MNDIPQEILTRIDALAATLGTTVEVLWPAMVAAERANALGYLGGLSFALGLCLVGLRHFLKAEDDEGAIVAAFCGAMVLILLVMLCVTSGPIAANIVAPEAAAARELLEALK